MNYEKLAKELIENVGGKGNIQEVRHCVTRVRFILHDQEIPKDDIIRNIEGVTGISHKAGQYQIIIGPDVTYVYDEVIKVLHNEEDITEDSKHGKQKVLDRIINIVSEIFFPVVGVMSACGVLRGVLILLSVTGILPENSGTYQILNSIANALFYYLPVYFGYTTMKKFGGNPFIGMTIGLVLCSPDILAIAGREPISTVFEGTVFQANVQTTFLGIPIMLMNYTSSVLPAIFGAIIAAKIELALSKVVPKQVKFLFVTLLTLLITIPLILLIIGPITIWVSSLVGICTIFIYELSPILCGAVIGVLWFFFIIAGVHQGIIPIAISNVMTMGYDVLLPLSYGLNFALIGATLIVFIKTKNKQRKEIAASGIVSAFFGITEPGLFGILLPMKKVFLAALIGSGVSGAFAGLLNVRFYTMGTAGIFGLLSFINPANGSTESMMCAAFCASIAFVISVIVMLILLKKDASAIE